MPDDAEIEDALMEFHLTGDAVLKDIQKELSNRRANSTSFAPLSNDDNNDESNEKENQAGPSGRGRRSTKATAANKSTASKTSTSARGGRGRGRAAAGPSTRNDLNDSVRHKNVLANNGNFTEYPFFRPNEANNQQFNSHWAVVLVVLLRASSMI